MYQVWPKVEVRVKTVMERKYYRKLVNGIFTFHELAQ
jgi:hypothetical protein